jgi:hypothetical protein
MATVIVGAYWGPREESREACAQRWAVFFEVLRRHDPELGRWYKRMNSRDEPILEMPTDALNLAPLLRENRDAAPSSKIIPELGFGLGAWRGPDVSASASFTSTLGSLHPRIVNACVISCDDTTATPEILQAMLRAEVEAFDPDDAIVN